MKVCTDACIQGAYAANWLARGNKSIKNVLDIGTGTGLLTLMLAQKNPSFHFDAVELNEPACLQAKDNFFNSPWNENIAIIHGDIRTILTRRKFDFIICNPPFYEDEMKSNKAHKNQSKHSSMLSHQELQQFLVNNLSENGTCCIMLPEKQLNRFSRMLMKGNLYPLHLLKLRQTPSHSIFRIVGFFGPVHQPFTCEELCITNERREYSPAFTALLRDYYLYLDA